jgi:hypothetical protein
LTAVSSSLAQAAGAITELNSGLSNVAGDLDRLRGESRRGIAAVAAIGAVGVGGQSPGEMGIDIGVAGYRGQGAVATNISYVTESGVVVSAGASYAGSGSAVVRLGIGFRVKLGNKVTVAAPANATNANPGAANSMPVTDTPKAESK